MARRLTAILCYDAVGYSLAMGRDEARTLADCEGEMRSFLTAVLDAYEVHGVDELVLSKIGDFLKVRYGGTNGAKRKLAAKPDIKHAFMDIQAHLYAPPSA